MDFPIGYNCAQKVAFAHGATQPEIEGLSKMGGGRAPDGLCGALYSALQFSREDARQGVQDAFQDKLGAIHCRELKAKGVPCSQCIATAIDILESQN